MHSSRKWSVWIKYIIFLIMMNTITAIDKTVKRKIKFMDILNYFLYNNIDIFLPLIWWVLISESRIFSQNSLLIHSLHILFYLLMHSMLKKKILRLKKLSLNTVERQISSVQLFNSLHFKCQLYFKFSKVFLQRWELFSTNK